MTVMPRDHEWTVADLANTPDDGLRYELVDGVLLVSAAPSNVHQIVLGELSRGAPGGVPGGRARHARPDRLPADPAPVPAA